MKVNTAAEWIIYYTTDIVAGVGEWLMLLHYRYDTYLFNKRHGTWYAPPRLKLHYEPLRAPDDAGKEGEG